MLAALPLIVQGVEAAISAAPQVEEIVSTAKAFFTSLFNAGLISADQQNAVHAHVDAVAAAVAAGTTPPEFQVQPDPAA